MTIEMSSDTLAERGIVRTRWEEPFLRGLLAEALDAARTGGDWHALLYSASTAHDDSDLEGAPLAGLDLSGIDLSGARLVHADLRGTNLSNAVLRDARFQWADCTGAVLTDVIFVSCDMACATLRDVRARNARFERVTLTAADLRGGDFAGAEFVDCRVARAAIDPDTYTRATFSSTQPTQFHRLPPG